MTDPLLGSMVSGRYRIDRLIARGGMGAIYRAEQLPLGRAVALKVLVQRNDDSGELQRRFLREAETCARLRHPNTVTIYDYGTLPLPDGEGEGLYIAMELIAGRTLSQAIREDGAFSPQRVSDIAVQIARSLREAHAAGIVHRDLKPGNVMLTPGSDGEREAVKVLDFGVAKVMGEGADGLTVAGSFVGSPRYASPEQIQEMEVDGRSDLYALGVVMYEMLVGVPPFQASDTIRMLMMHVRDLPAPLEGRVQGVPPELAALVHSLLEKEPGRRPADADAVIQALRSPGEASVYPGAPEPLSVDTATWRPPTVARSRGKLGLVVIGALGLFAMLAVCAGGLWVALPGLGLGSGEGPDRAGGPGSGPERPEGGGVEGAVEGPERVGGLSPGAPKPVQVTSVPAGAEVWDGATKVGVTPLVIPVDGEKTLRVHLDGYEDVEHSVTDGDEAWSATLVQMPTVPVKPPKGNPAKGDPPKTNPPKGDGIRTSR